MQLIHHSYSSPSSSVWASQQAACATNIHAHIYLINLCLMLSVPRQDTVQEVRTERLLKSEGERRKHCWVSVRNPDCKQALRSWGSLVPYPTHVLTLWSWGEGFGADDGAAPDKLTLGWVCCSFVFWTNYSRGLCEALCVGLFIHLKDTRCSVNASFPCAQDTPPGLCDSHLCPFCARGIQTQTFLSPSHALTLLSWSSAALPALLPKGSASTDCCTTQWIPRGFACGSNTSLWPGNPTGSRYDFKDHYLISCASPAKIQINVQRQLCTAHPCLTTATFRIKHGQNHCHINENSFHEQQKEGMKWCCTNCGTKWSHRVIYKDFR